MNKDHSKRFTDKGQESTILLLSVSKSIKRQNKTSMQVSLNVLSGQHRGSFYHRHKGGSGPRVGRSLEFFTPCHSRRRWNLNKYITTAW